MHGVEEAAKRLVANVQEVAINEESRERRRQARVNKGLGDLCLMAGSPRDALDMYQVRGLV